MPQNARRAANQPVSSLKASIAEASTAAVRAKDRERVKALRLVNAALKQAEIDGRKPLEDADVLTVLAKMRKQRLDSLDQFTRAEREDLAAIERYELAVIDEFMPQMLSDEELGKAVQDAIAATGASSMKDMGKVMGKLKAEFAGRVDMAAASREVKAALT